MELYLQFGYGMMDHCKSLIKEWGGGTAVLSPRDLNDKQLRKLATDICKLPGGKVLLDPQFYLPHADHPRLSSHGFWPTDYSSGVFWQGPALVTLLDNLFQLNDDLACSEVVLPGMLASRIDDDWLDAHEMILEEAKGRATDKQLMLTIALSADALRVEDQVARLIDRAETWEIGAYYVVAEHPRGAYLVDDPIWTSNLLDLCAALRMRGAKVVLGYCNQQMLIASCAKVTAICSGTWMNVRSFPPDKFRATYDDEIKQRSTWYYCPQALSEYKIPFLDVANSLGLLPRMRPVPEVADSPARALFSGVQPTTVGWSEKNAFRHYLLTLQQQAQISATGSFEDAIALHIRRLATAEALLDDLSRSGVTGQLRDYGQIISADRAALSVFSRTRGIVLSRLWQTI